MILLNLVITVEERKKKREAVKNQEDKEEAIKKVQGAIEGNVQNQEIEEKRNTDKKVKDTEKKIENTDQETEVAKIESIDWIKTSIKLNILWINILTI